MKQRFIAMLLVLFLLASLTVTVSAFPGGFGDDGGKEENTQTFIIDEAGLMKDREREALEEEAAELAEEYDCGVYVLTVDTMNGEQSRPFSENYYLENDLGVGDYKNGILFFVCMDTRDYITITYGQHPTKDSKFGVGRLAFSDKGVEYMEEQIVPFLSEGEYGDAFACYVELCGEYLAYYDENDEPKEPMDAGTFGIRLAIVVFLPLLTALVVCLIFRSQMKTARSAESAGDYIPEESFHLTLETDQYVRTTRTQTKIEQSSSSGSGGRGSGSFGGSKGGKF